MGHIHNVYDTNAHFKIDSVTRTVKNASETKYILVNHDHNSERYTFEIPRYIDGHDMSRCNAVQIHYLNVELSSKNKYAGVYEVDDLHVDPDYEDIVICSWLVSRNATQYVGSLGFTIRFACVSEGKNDYVWNTSVYSGIRVVDGIYNDHVITYDYIDIFEQWRKKLFDSVPVIKVISTPDGDILSITDKNGTTEVPLNGGNVQSISKEELEEIWNTNNKQEGNK